MAAARRGYQRRPAGQSPAAKYGDVYEQVNNRILASLDAGAVPWQRPWPASVGRPMSMASGQPYNGVNVLLAGMTALERGYTSPWWGTKLQINALGGHIRQGQRQSEGKGATYISVWNEREVKPTAEEVAAGADPDEPKIKVYGSMRGVFNADQCEGLPERFYPEPGAPVEEIAEPEAVLAAYDATPGAALLLYDVHGQAYYDPDADRIHMPSRDGHISAERYYQTGYHERVHSTGHKDRLDRPEVGHGHKFGSPGYGREELVAQMGAAYLCAATGIDTPEVAEQDAAYLQSWITTIKEDKQAVVKAASGASKAADLILEPSRQADPGTETEPEPEPEPAYDGGIEAA
jgi:antirestriction protein ArdC